MPQAKYQSTALVLHATLIALLAKPQSSTALLAWLLITYCKIFALPRVLRLTCHRQPPTSVSIAPVLAYSAQIRRQLAHPVNILSSYSTQIASMIVRLAITLTLQATIPFSVSAVSPNAHHAVRNPSALLASLAYIFIARVVFSRVQALLSAKI